jgi:hypothetical protein
VDGVEWDEQRAAGSEDGKQAVKVTDGKVLLGFSNFVFFLAWGRS